MTTDKLPTEARMQAGAEVVKRMRSSLNDALPEIWRAMEAVRPPVGEEVVLRVRDAIRRVKEDRHAPITGDEELEARAAIIAMQSNG
jgi:hypothetical protein